MKNWKIADVGYLTEMLRDWADDRGIFIGVDSRRMTEGEGKMIYICQDCEFKSIRLLVNFNEVDSLWNTYSVIVSRLEKELNTMGYRPAFYNNDNWDAMRYVIPHSHVSKMSVADMYPKFAMSGDYNGDCVRYCAADVTATMSLYNHLNPKFEIEKVIFNDPATIVIWEDGSKTVVKAQDGETYDPEKGLAMAISKRALGDKGSYYDIFDKWLKTYEPKLSKHKSGQEKKNEKVITTTVSPSNPMPKEFLEQTGNPYFVEEFPLDTEEGEELPVHNKDVSNVCDNCESRFLDNDDYPCTKCDDNFSNFILRKDLCDINGETPETTPKN